MTLIQYIKETQSELKHASWPTRRQAITFTFVVILVSVGTALFLGVFDYLFKIGLEKILIK
jgi:preprotein translocase SecE subunit